MTLIPYDKREGIPLNVAAERAGKSPGTIRNWCIEHGIGRRVGGGQWIVGKLALTMFLDDDAEALRLSKAGDRSSNMQSLNLELSHPSASLVVKINEVPVPISDDSETILFIDQIGWSTTRVEKSLSIRSQSLRPYRYL